MEYCYRKAKKEDVKAISELVTKLLGTCNLDYSHSIEDNNYEEIKQRIQNYYVCSFQNEIIGACGLDDHLTEDEFDLGLTNIQNILYFVVDSNHQKKGIGTKLLTLVMSQQKGDILYDAWGDNGEYVNSKFILEKCGFELYRDLGNNWYKDHGYCSLCVNRNKKCNSCLAQIWIKKYNR